MSRSRSKVVGEAIEDQVIASHPLEDVESEAVDAPDAVASSDGTEIEIKACRRRVSNGDHSVHGRWYIRRRAHEALLEAGGYYLLVVYEEDDGELEIVDEQLRRADVVDELIDRCSSWSRVRSRGEETVAKLTHFYVSSPEVHGP